MSDQTMERLMFGISQVLSVCEKCGDEIITEHLGKVNLGEEYVEEIPLFKGTRKALDEL
ncbi:hypothetical protein N8148_03035 [Gammaproteobacteria bacterium]|nr:hypothetical protein [Gammaproteobacteria bacterium]